MLLRDKDRIRLIDIFSEVKEPVEVLAFGSRVSGRAHEGSDLDLLIRSLNDKPLEGKLMHKLRQKISDSNIPIVVELFEWFEIPESFRKNIMAGYEVLYSTETAQPH
jgi:predicted nucleotidyltransferase